MTFSLIKFFPIPEISQATAQNNIPCIVLNEHACLNKRTPTFEFRQLYPSQYLLPVYLYETFKVKS